MAMTKKDLAVLRVALRLEAAQFRKEAKKSRDEVKKMRGDFKKSAGDFKKFAVSMASIGVAIAGVRSAFSQLSAVMEKTEVVGRFADRVGVSVEALSALEYHFGSAGASAAAVDTSLQRFVKRLGQLKTGSTDAAKAFAKAGLSLEDFKGLTNEQAFVKFLNTLAGITDQAIRLDATVALLDSEGAALLPGIADIPATMDEIIAAAREVGAIITEDMVGGAKEFNQQITDMKSAWDGFIRNVGGSFLEAIQPGLDALKQTADGGRIGTRGPNGGGDVERSGFAWTKAWYAYWFNSEANAERMNKLEEQRAWIEDKRQSQAKYRTDEEKAQLAIAKKRLDAEKEAARVAEKAAKAEADAEAKALAHAALMEAEEIDSDARKANADALREKFAKGLEQIKNSAPAAQGVGAVRKGTVAGFSAIQSSFRNQQQSTFMDRERNVLLKEINRRIEAIGEKPIPVRI